ncbi:MAG: zinc ABC transporter substrate-binding protein [Muribaculaceae bacterium]|nr:zinc ABC transporter substrate-binding protein [Muribaculaceae bacterium]MDE6320847.1 zinc ABC transporter substrate-binding protein [Muribaculaceae bacterium]
MKKILFKLTLLAISLMVVASACSGSSSDKLKVTVSIPPQKYMLEQIAGDKVDIVTLMDAGSNPETYNPSVSTIVGLHQSEIYFTVGTLPFEQKLAQEGELNIVDTSKGVKLIHGTHGDCDASHHHDHGDSDPHIWSSVPNVKIMARNMTDALCQADEANADYYLANLKTFEAKLDSLDGAYRTRLGDTDHKAFVIFHPSLSYLARDYGLEQIAVGQEGKESTINAQRERIEHAREHSAKVMFVQQEFDSRQASTVASEIGVNTVTINPMNANWLGEMEKVVNALTDNE